MSEVPRLTDIPVFDSDLIDRTVEATHRLIELETKKIEAMGQLAKALRLAQLLKIPPKDMSKPVRYHVQPGGSAFCPWVRAVFMLRYGEDEHEFPLVEVHKDLWPQKMLDAYASWEKVKERREATHTRRQSFTSNNEDKQ